MKLSALCLFDLIGKQATSIGNDRCTRALAAAYKKIAAAAIY
jgi:hypothetical protein